ncbi:MAG: T9SS type A sorting domain-containing protein [Bacteroidetes bacterium]|nr:T9SS type A sorting domain-containing protein [Bacteroidota bacterium]
MNLRRLFTLILLAVTGKQIQAQSPDWAEKIAPILYTNCSGCHIEGGIAPMSFTGYEAAKTYAYSIKGATQSKSMPPWPADPQYRRMAHEKLLSAQEIQDISDWVDAGMPSGDTTKAPAAPSPKTGSSILNANLKLKMPDYKVKTSNDEYRCFVLPTGLSADKFLTEIEVVPGNYSVVHHVLVFHDTSKVPLQLDSADPNPGYLGFGGTGSSTSKMIGVWVPGQDPFQMPPGMGIKLEKNGYIILQVHYPANIQDVTDSSKVYLKYSSSALREVGIAPALNHIAPSLQNGPLYIPANQKKDFTSKYTVPIDISIFAVAPHMHLIGQKIKAFGVVKPGDTNKFISIPQWDFHWQRTYTFTKVQKIPSGTVLWGNASYDNTSGNPLNPNKPPKAVSLGEATTDEMMLVYFWYTLYQNGDENMVLDTTQPKNLSHTNSFATHSIVGFPNPAGEIYHLRGVTNEKDRLNYQLFNVAGKLIPCSWKWNGEEVEFDIRNLAAGNYYLKISGIGFTKNMALIKL